MERETKSIKLSFCEIEAKTYLTWGENELIESILLSGAKNITQDGVSGFDSSILTKQKIKLLETIIVNIHQGDKGFKFTKEWFENLKMDQGEEILREIDTLIKPSKKN